MMQLGFSLLMLCMFIGIMGCIGVIKKSPDDPPYNVLMPLLMGGGFLCCIIGILMVMR